MNWFDKILPPKIKSTTKIGKRGVPEGLWTKCTDCSSVLYRAELERNLDVCPKCNHHMRINAAQRLQSFLDADSYSEIAPDLRPLDILKFRDSRKYKDRISEAQKRTGQHDALLALEGALHGRPVVALAFEFEFMGGSMGSVVGEKFVRAVARCLEMRCALICFSASGGARMQEALFSLMQMAKTSAALNQLARQRLPLRKCDLCPIPWGTLCLCLSFTS